MPKKIITKTVIPDYPVPSVAVEWNPFGVSKQSGGHQDQLIEGLTNPVLRMVLIERVGKKKAP